MEINLEIKCFFFSINFMSKRIYLYILLVATFFCSSCNFSASEEKFLNESELSFSISRNVLAQIDSSVETTVTIHTEVLKENTVIIDNLQDRKLLFNENNEPYLESITLNKVPLYCPLVFKMQVLLGDNLFAEGQSEEVVFSRKNKRLNLQLAVVLQDEPEIELKINQTSIAVEEWEENATFTATEGFDSYNWTCGDQTGTTKEFVVDISKLNVAEYEVKLVAKKGETECYATSKLTVNAISTPLVITEKDDSTENRYSFILFEANDGFSNYEWKCGKQTGSGNSFTINLSSLNPGEHQVILTATKGTKQYTVTKTFVINSKIIIGEFTQSEVEISLSSIKYMEGYEKLFFTASEGFDSYTWKYANKNVSGNSIELDTSTLPLGKYVLQLLAVKNGIEYSAQVEFRIEQKLSFNIEIADLEIKIIEEADEKIIFSVPEGYDSYEWIYKNQRGYNNTFELNFATVGDDWSIFIRVIAIKNGIEYSAEFTY